MLKEAVNTYAVYIVRCADDTLYTGFTTDVAKRVETHNSGKTGAKYTKVRRPVVLVHAEYFESKSQAMKREWEIKQLTRAEKLALIK
ncbi:MAG: GIY-YIG nuclease family protein [Patescibacteria group bacterium]